MNIIEFKDISVFYSHNSRPVLKNISCSVKPLSYVGVIGPNGGGKTTLLKVLLNLIRPAQGTVRLFGKEPQKVLSSVGYVPQFPIFDRHYPISVLDVVLMGLLHSKFSSFSSNDRHLAMESLARVSMQSQSHNNIASLSGGQLQRVLLARAIVSRPRLLLLDEPTASVDGHIERDFYALLKELNCEMTILLVSHDIGIITKEVSDIMCVNQSLSVHKAETITRENLTDLYNNPVKCVDHHCQI